MAAVKRAYKFIKIIHEDISADPEYEKAHEILSTAKRIYFLGFGYNSVNYNRLQIDNAKIADIILGSSYGITRLEAGKIEQLSPGRLQLKNKEGNMDVLRFLREFISLD